MRLPQLLKWWRPTNEQQPYPIRMGLLFWRGLPAAGAEKRRALRPGQSMRFLRWREAIPALPEQYRKAASRVSYSDLTFQKSFSRCDDEKNVRFESYLPSADDLLAEAPSAKGKKAPAEKKEQATQQRLTAELLAVGVSLYSSIIAIDLNELELGCLLSALEMFSYCPMIGGQRGRGHGLVSLDYTFTDLDAGTSEPLVTIPRCGAFQMSVRAQAAQSAYRHQVMSQREALMDGEGRQSELGALLLEAA